MPFVSVTRLRPRSLRFMPALLWHSFTSRRQIRRAPGFLAGYFATGRGMALWTVTVWDSEAAMRGFRNSGVHQRAMPLLIRACDEAAVTHWEQPGANPPPPETAATHMEEGRLSKVRHPSPEHLAGHPWPDHRIPLRGPAISPKH